MKPESLSIMGWRSALTLPSFYDRCADVPMHWAAKALPIMCINEVTLLRVIVRLYGVVVTCNQAIRCGPASSQSFSRPLNTRNERSYDISTFAMNNYHVIKMR